MTTAEQILEATAEAYDISVDAIKGRCRERDIVKARYMVMYLMNQEGISEIEISRLFNCQQSTVYHAINKTRGLFSSDRMSRAIRDEILARIK